MTTKLAHSDTNHQYYDDIHYNLYVKWFINRFYDYVPKIVHVNNMSCKHFKLSDVKIDEMKFVSFDQKLDYDIFSLDCDLFYTFLYLQIKYQFLLKPSFNIYEEEDCKFIISSHKYLFDEFYKEFNVNNIKKWNLYVYIYDDVNIVWSRYMVMYLKCLKKCIILGKNHMEFDPLQDNIIPYNIFNYVPNLKQYCNDVFDYNFNTLPNMNIIDFNNRTLESLVLTGTACVGKTSLQIKLHNETQIPIYKHTLFDGFKNKDDCQINALLYQLSGFSTLTNNNELYIADRGPLDNFIWRIIMTLVGKETKEEILNEFFKILQHINHYSFSGFHRKPWIIILEVDEYKNRERMKKRDDGGDYYRAFLPNYVNIQNLVYFTIGYLCRSIIITNDHLASSEIAILSFLNNAKESIPMGRIINKYSFTMENQLKNYDSIAYEHAKSLNIFK